MELWIRTGPHRIDISDDNSWSPDVLDTWINQAIRAIVTIDTAIRAIDTQTDADPNVH